MEDNEMLHLLQEEPTPLPEGIDRDQVDKIARDLLIGADLVSDAWDTDAVMYAVIKSGEGIDLIKLARLPDDPGTILTHLVETGIQLADDSPDGHPILGLAMLVEAWGTTVPQSERTGRVVDLPEDRRMEVRMVSLVFRNGANGSIVHERGQEIGDKVMYSNREAARHTRFPSLLYMLLTGEEL